LLKQRAFPPWRGAGRGKTQANHSRRRGWAVSFDLQKSPRGGGIFRTLSEQKQKTPKVSQVCREGGYGKSGCNTRIQRRGGRRVSGLKLGGGLGGRGGECRGEKPSGPMDWGGRGQSAKKTLTRQGGEGKSSENHTQGNNCLRIKGKEKKNCLPGEFQRKKLRGVLAARKESQLWGKKPYEKRKGN